MVSQVLPLPQVCPVLLPLPCFAPLMSNEQDPGLVFFQFHNDLFHLHTAPIASPIGYVFTIAVPGCIVSNLVPKPLA